MLENFFSTILLCHRCYFISIFTNSIFDVLFYRLILPIQSQKASNVNFKHEYNEKNWFKKSHTKWSTSLVWPAFCVTGFEKSIFLCHRSTNCIFMLPLICEPLCATALFAPFSLCYRVTIVWHRLQYIFFVIAPITDLVTAFLCYRYCSVYATSLVCHHSFCATFLFPTALVFHWQF